MGYLIKKGRGAEARKLAFARTSAFSIVLIHGGGSGRQITQGRHIPCPTSVK